MDYEADQRVKLVDDFFAWLLAHLDPVIKPASGRRRVVARKRCHHAGTALSEILHEIVLRSRRQLQGHHGSVTWVAQNATSRILCAQEVQNVSLRVLGPHTPRKRSSSLNLLQDVVAIRHQTRRLLFQELFVLSYVLESHGRLVDAGRLLRWRQLLLHQITGQGVYSFT